MSELEQLRNKIAALETAALNVFVDMTGHPDFDPCGSIGKTIPVSVSHVGSLAVALFSVLPVSDARAWKGPR